MQSASSRLKVMVRDTGVGMAESDQQKIFEIYSRLNGNKEPQVCGLGLSISTALVNKLGGGSICVKSAIGKGSTFSFEIDIGEVCKPTETYSDEETTEIEEDTGLSLFIPRSVASQHDFNTPHRYPEILIVDDVPFNREVARKMIESGGHLCEEASTGLQAVKLVRKRMTQNRPFRVILMDIDMPEMDGLSATRAILQLSHSESMSAPIIIGCSAYCSEDDKAVGLQAGMSQYLFKPIARAELLQAITNFV